MHYHGNKNERRAKVEQVEKSPYDELYAKKDGENETGLPSSDVGGVQKSLGVLLGILEQMKKPHMTLKNLQNNQKKWSSAKINKLM